jgi:small subunit ribosomal protein S18
MADKTGNLVNLDDVFDDRNIIVESDGAAPTRRRRKKVVQNLKCPICESGEKNVSYKDVYQLKKYTSVRGKIISSEKSGVCGRHQRQLSSAIKRARYLALLPYLAVE